MGEDGLNLLGIVRRDGCLVARGKAGEVMSQAKLLGDGIALVVEFDPTSRPDDGTEPSGSEPRGHTDIDVVGNHWGGAHLRNRDPLVALRAGHAGDLLEVVVMISSEGDQLVIHAMAMPPIYRRLLERDRPVLKKLKTESSDRLVTFRRLDRVGVVNHQRRQEEDQAFAEPAALRPDVLHRAPRLDRFRKRPPLMDSLIDKAGFSGSRPRRA